MTDELRRKIGRMVPPELIEGFESSLRWGADQAWRDAFEPIGLRMPPIEPAEVEAEVHRLVSQRRHLGCRALLDAARRTGVPLEYRHIGGGHKKAFAQCGEVILMAEPLRFVEDTTRPTAYKSELADCLYSLRQLTLPFREWPPQRIDGRSTVFAILQFTLPVDGPAQSSCTVRSIQLVVPTQDLKDVQVRSDVCGNNFRLKFIEQFDVGSAPREQEDKVRVLLRPRRQKRTSEDG